MLGVELDPKHVSARQFVEALLKHGVLSKDTHGAVARFAPALIVESRPARLGGRTHPRCAARIRPRIREGRLSVASSHRRFVGFHREYVMKNPVVLLAACLLLGAATIAAAQETRSYKEGNVVAISYIKVKDGKFNDYMKYLGGTYRDLMEANKKAGLVVSYAIYSNQARSPSDPDLYLTVTYPNWAAFDRVEEGLAIAAKVAGAMSVRDKAYADRSVMREVLGSNVVQELILK